MFNDSSVRLPKPIRAFAFEPQRNFVVRLWRASGCALSCRHATLSPAVTDLSTAPVEDPEWILGFDIPMEVASNHLAPPIEKEKVLAARTETIVVARHSDLQIANLWLPFQKAMRMADFAIDGFEGDWTTFSR